MGNLSAYDRLVPSALRVAVAIPFVYFGIQVIAASLYPGYSFLNRDASTLGSEGSAHPWIFNGGSIIVGIMSLVAAWGFLRALAREKVHPLLAWLTCLALMAFGLESINAGIFPLPDPRHASGPLAIIGVGCLAIPVLLPAALWKLRDVRRLKIFFVVNLLVLIALLPIISGMIQVVLVKSGTEWPSYQNFLNNYHGLLQRVAAFILLAPISAAAYVLARRFKDLASPATLAI